MLNWGFVLLQKDRAPKRVTNIRDDKAQSKFWRPSFEQRRCLVPASSYCEPKGEKPATWHWLSINGNDARPVFAFPGVWTRYRGPLKKYGETVEQEVFSFMTTEPTSSLPASTTSACRCCSPIAPTSRRGSRVQCRMRSSSRAATRPTKCGSCSRVRIAKTFWLHETWSRRSTDRPSELLLQVRKPPSR